MTRDEVRRLLDRAKGYQCTYSPGYMKVPVTPEELRWICEQLLESMKPKMIKRLK